MISRSVVLVELHACCHPLILRSQQLFLGRDLLNQLLRQSACFDLHLHPQHQPSVDPLPCHPFIKLRGQHMIDILIVDNIIGRRGKEKCCTTKAFNHSRTEVASEQSISIDKPISNMITKLLPMLVISKIKYQFILRKTSYFLDQLCTQL